MTEKQKDSPTNTRDNKLADRTEPSTDREQDGRVDPSRDGVLDSRIESSRDGACGIQDGGGIESSSFTTPSPVLIITNVADVVFTSTEAKSDFESMFRRFDQDAQLQYLKTFHRARVSFSNVSSATDAHTELDRLEVMGEKIRCYYAQAPVGQSVHEHLKPPPPAKQYLISPPASPPPDWEVIPERTPAINYDLIAAIAAMGPGKSYEVHSGSATQPSIVVHVSDDPEGYADRPTKIEQTRRPDTNHNPNPNHNSTKTEQTRRPDSKP